ncbi:MAG: ABC transporter ATP-binding protein [Candidatus Omnitrophota bacterium]|jgi:iron complex transport system ATP-binding protein|nr:MAG: ABC transporter ATP-binding protein [Candidatus Omnitrophota bacterium]
MATEATSLSPVVHVKNVQFHYPRDGFVLRDINLQLPPGSFTVILGPNGSGKSTLIRLLCGLLVPDAGAVELDSLPLHTFSARRRGRTIAFLSQNEPGHLPYSVFDLVMMGRFPYQGFWPFDSQSDIRTVYQAMERVSVAHLKNRYISELSGGERQRAYLARALAQTPRILLLDEPASNLDLAHQIELYQLLHQFNCEEQMTIVTVSHEINLATRYSSQIVLMKDGTIAHAGNPQSALTETNLDEIYQVKMLVIEDPETGQQYFFPKMK